MDTGPTVLDDFGARLLDTRQAAEALGLSTRTLEDWRLRGVGPRYVRMSPRAVRYRPRELSRWVSEREVQSTSEQLAGTSTSNAGPRRQRGDDARPAD